MENLKPFFVSAACLLAAAGAFAQTTNQTPTYTVQTIHQFPATGAEGVNPQGLILGLDGNFYGTTGSTFFRLSPGGNLTTLHTFTGAPSDASPNPSLAMDKSGTIYGLTNDSAAFSVMPGGVYTLLGPLPTAGGPYSFRLNGLASGGDGNLYGTTVGTGTNPNQGMLFQITPGGQITEITTFDGMPSLMVAGPGNLLYGLVFGTSAATLVSVTYDGVITPLATLNPSGIGNPIGFGPVLAGGNFYIEGSDTLIEISPSRGVTMPPSLLGAWDSSFPIIAGGDGNLYVKGKMLYQVTPSFQVTAANIVSMSSDPGGCNALVVSSNGFYCTGGYNNIAGGAVYELVCKSGCFSPGGSGGGAATPATVITKTLGNPSDCPGGCDAGDPINVATGNLFEKVEDYRTAGANPLGFTRYYNSMTAPSSFAVSLGANWRSNYARYLRIASSTSVIAERGDGQQVAFTLTGGAWTPDTDVDIKLTNSGTAWTLTDSRDTVETYAMAGAGEALLQTIRARNGYTQTLLYNSSNQLTSVTDSFQRRLSFTYANGLLQTVTTPDALVLTYGYSGGGATSQLSSVSYSTSPATSQTYLYENAALPNALTGVIDEDGNRYSTWAYDSTGRALSSQHAGRADLTTIAYNTDGSRTVRNALGEQEVYKFTTIEGVPKVTEIDRMASGTVAAATRKFTYDSNGYVASQTDWNGNLTTFVNDVHGQPTTINEAVETPQARTTSITYLSNFHLPSQIVTPGLTISLTYDSNAELLTKKLTDTTTATAPYATGGQTRTWTYTWSNFLLASAQTPRTDVKGLTTFTYDSSGALTAITNALGQTTRITAHLPGGAPQTSVDPNGVTTNLTYDARLRLLSSTIATGAGPLTTSYSYDATGNLVTATRADGSALTYSYDAAHRLTGVTDLFGQSVSYALDALGDRTKTNTADSSANLQLTQSGQFDALGRLIEDIGGAGQTTGFTYDSNGNSLTLTDPLTHTTARAFDALNRVTAVTDAAGGVTTTSYDAHDRPLSVTDPNGAVTTYVYDGFGDMIQRVSPDSGTTVYRYDGDGNLSQSIDGAGATTNYTYDALDRVKTASYPADTAENASYTYDQGNFGIGRLTGVTDAAGVLTRSYDERGNMLNETRVNGAAKLVTAYTYDAASQVATLTYPSGWTAAYARDAMGRVVSVTAQAPNGGASVPVLASVAYQPFGPVNAMMFGNGVAETRSFDLDYRVTALADAGTASLQNLTYAYDAADNVLSITDGVTAANSQTLGYDALNRLTSATGGYGAYTYTYDASGNRVGMSVKLGSGTSSVTLGYNPQTNQFTSVMVGAGKETFGYDKAGSVISFTPANGKITSLTYNQAGRLSAALAGSNPIAQYTYDAFGRRLAKVAASATLYQYDRKGQLLEEADGQGNPLVDYLYLDSMPIATISPGAGQFYFLHDDRLGTPQVASDSNQNVAWLSDYGPFGELGAIPSLIVQNLRLPGQEADSDTGFYHNGFRDYMPAWGRYLESDPVGLAGGVNTYAYALANPAKLTDPLGLYTWSDFENQVDSIYRDLVNHLPSAEECKRAAERAKQWLDQHKGTKVLIDLIKVALKDGVEAAAEGAALVLELFKWGAKQLPCWGDSCTKNNVPGRGSHLPPGSGD